ncbi:MAG: chemotaxis protein [Salinarimonadaceae bacterium]|nr:MAG: chemotaxis protein [Salinarimonadaceae bacterium]
MIELFLSAIALGLLFNAAPGAVFAESLRRGLRGGYRPALAVQVGSLVGDFVWAVLGLLGAAALFALPHVGTPLAIAGALLLAWLAWRTLLDGLGPMPIIEPAVAPQTGADGARAALAVGAAISLGNPMNVTYWAGLGGVITSLGAQQPGWTAFAVFLTGFMLSSVAWCFICAGAIATTRRRIGPRAWRALNLVCAAGLAYFAALVAARQMGWAG